MRAGMRSEPERVFTRAEFAYLQALLRAAPITIPTAGTLSCRITGIISSNPRTETLGAHYCDRQSEGRLWQNYHRD